jgi:hypothetical protein
MDTHPGMCSTVQSLRLIDTSQTKAEDNSIAEPFGTAEDGIGTI